MVNFNYHSINNATLILLIQFTLYSIFSEQLIAVQQNCPDRFLKNAKFLLKKKKTADALSTFNQIVRNFPKCPQAEEAQWQLIKYYSRIARSSGSDEYYQLSDEHIEFYLRFWPKGAYRKSVLKERSWNKTSSEPFKMRRGRFIAIIGVALATTIALTLGSK